MGVYIQKMEMPKNCGECPCYYFEYKECNAIGGRMVFRNATPPTDCPLVELPPHGDLIDRDEAYNRFLDLMKIQGGINPCQLGTILVDAPTVVESEDGDG